MNYKTLPLLLLVLVPLLPDSYVVEAQLASIPDFELTLAPSSTTVVRGETALFLVRIRSVRAFTGAVTFGLERMPDGVVTSFDPPFVAPPPDGFAFSTLSVNPQVPFIRLPASGGPINASTGFFVFTVFAIQSRFISTGVNMTQAKRFDVSMRVIEPGTPDFAMGIFPDQQFTNFQAFSATTVSTGVFVEPRNGFTGQLTFDLPSPPPGLSFTFEPRSLTFASGEGKKTSFLKITLFQGFSTITTNYIFAITATLANQTGFGLTKSGIFKLTVAAIPDFSVIVSPSVKSITPGGSANYNLILRSAPTVALGFQGPVQFDLRGSPRLPFDVTFSYNPQPVTVTPGLDETATLTITTSPRVQPDNYNLTVLASGGGTTKRQFVTLSVTPVGDFNVTLDPPSIGIGLGFSRVVNVQVQSLGGFQSLVNLTVAGGPGPDSGVSVTVNPDNVQPNPSNVPCSSLRGSALASCTGSLAVSSLVVTTTKSAQARTYVFSVIGKSGIVSHEAKFIVAVRNAASCLVATAAFGSELSPEVLFLRGFRDLDVMRTEAGYGFLTFFNPWYYSFSPVIATGVHSSPFLQSVARAMLYPLVFALRVSDAIFDSASRLPELAIVSSGLTAAFVLGLVYLSPLVLAVNTIRRRKIALRWVVPVFAASSAALLLGELTSNTWLVGAGAVMMVLGVTVVAGLLPTKMFLRRRPGSYSSL